MTMLDGPSGSGRGEAKKPYSEPTGGYDDLSDEIPF